MPLAQLDLDVDLATLTLNRPDKRNALSREMLEEIAARLDEAEDAGVRALLVEAEGPAFCAGGDIGWMEDRLGKPEATRQALGEHLGPVILELDRFPAPTVAAVQGAAIGAGLGLALACDVTLASREAVLGATHTRLGLTPDAGTSWQLAQTLGPKRALDLLLEARTFEGSEAAEMGLVTEAVADDELPDEARARARRLAKGPTKAYVRARQLVRRASTDPLEAMLSREADAQADMYATRDQREGVQAFLEDRDPEFTGG